MKINTTAYYSLLLLLLALAGAFTYGAIILSKSGDNTSLTLELENLTTTDQIIEGSIYLESNNENYLVKVSNHILPLNIKHTKVDLGVNNELLIYGQDKKLFKLITYLNNKSTTYNQLQKLLKDLNVTIILNYDDFIHHFRKQQEVKSLYESKEFSNKAYFKDFVRKNKTLRNKNINNILKTIGLYRNTKYGRSNIIYRRCTYKPHKNFVNRRRISKILQKSLSYKETYKKV